MHKYIITSKYYPKTKKTIREVFECNDKITYTVMLSRLKKSPKRYNTITLTNNEPKIIKRAGFITIFNTVTTSKEKA